MGWERGRGSFTSRTKARRRAAEILFEADQRGIADSPADLLALLEERKTLTVAESPLPPYATTIVEGVATSLPQVDALIGSHVKGAGIDRIPAFDLAVLRVAGWELLANREDVPPITAIDEAVAVVKQMSTAQSPAYVNAVLDAARKDLEGRDTPPTLARPSLDPTPPAIEDEFDEAELLDEY